MNLELHANLKQPLVRLILSISSVLLLSLYANATAQTFNANNYYQQCLRFEAGGDLETAQQSCANALRVNPDFNEAKLALARIEIGLGDYASAEPRLIQLSKNTQNAEVLILLANISLQNNQLSAAESYLSDANRILTETFNSDLASQRSFLAGQIAQARNNYPAALSYYQQAISSDSLNVDYRLAAANLRFLLNDPAGAQNELELYQRLSNDTMNPEVLSLIGKLEWAQGDFTSAINTLETAVNRRGSRDTDAQARDLRTLALIYYGQGDVRSGGLALRAASRRGNLVSFLMNYSLPWLLLLLLLLALHLIGESRIASQSSLEIVEGPQLWTVGHIYGILFLSLLIGVVVALIYSSFFLHNLLAVATPLQSTDVRAVFLITVSIMLFLLVLQRVKANGWDALDVLLGSTQQLGLSILIGIGLLGLTVLYLAFKPDFQWLSGFYLNFSRLTPLLIGAVIVLPLSETFFRAFTVPTLARRYDKLLALLISSSLYALVLGMPVLLLFVFGLLLFDLFQRGHDGISPIVSQLVLNLGLVIGVAFSPWFQGLFL